MRILILSAAAFLLQLLLFLCTGTLVLRVRRRSAYGLVEALLLGYFVYFGLFEVLCLVFELRLLPLRTLSYTVAVCGAAVIACGIARGARTWAGWLRGLPKRAQEFGPLFLLVLVALVASAGFVVLYTDASADSGWYVGMASTALATNSIGRFDPSTGQMIKRFQARYALSCYPYHSAVVSDLVRGLPVIVQARSVMSAVNLLMSYLAAWKLGRSLLRRTVQTELFVLAVTFLNCFSGTIYLPGIFLYTRSYEGKALVLNVVLVVVLALCADVWRRQGTHALRTLFWVMAAGVCFSASSVMALVLCFAALLPLAVIKQRWRLVPAAVFGCLPVIAWAAVYYLMQHGMLVFWTYH